MRLIMLIFVGMLETKSLDSKEKFDVNLGAYYSGHVKKLRRHRMQAFGADGNVVVVDKHGKEEAVNGQVFMQEALDFFLSRDEAYAYRVCAELQSLINEHIRKYGRIISAML